ncbi:uncharacterized protein [Centruroides vittatus]|uniref:uncharacterized protein isoform X1 n=1 Tax=Centruroides vittatus TaxID=120091 RepID=UPI00350EB36A
MFSTVFYLLIAWRLSLQSHAEDKDLQVHGDVLHCPPCRKLHCWPKLHRLKCKGGITLGVCNCCPVCAKVAGESCGGQWNYLGKCDRSLYCQPQKATLYSYVVEDTKKVFSIGRGICKPGSPELSSDQAHSTFCRPKCTWEFCSKNPKAICSAIDNAEKIQECQGSCQHTSCRACRYLEREHSCIKCSRDDFGCMQKFGKCAKQKFCTRKKFPCKRDREKEETESKFQCQVAECLDKTENALTGKG